MAETGPMEPTGREFKEPNATLVELGDGERHYTSIRFDESVRRLEDLHTGIRLIRSFLERPMVVGLAEMVDMDAEAGSYTFATGPIWTLAEVLRAYRDVGQNPGVRAAVEMCYLAGQVLADAGNTGPREGCYSHGNLTPWRVALRADGSLQVFGYGIPAVDWLMHRKDPKFLLEADSLRYAPPERLEQDQEDPSADTYSLACIAWEMVTGDPLLKGHDLKKLGSQIKDATPQKTMAGAPAKVMPKAVSKVLSTALVYDPTTRLSGKQFVHEMATLLEGKLKGPTLVEVMERVRGTDRKTPRGRKIASTTDTGVYTPAQLAEMAHAEDGEPVPDSPPPKRYRAAKGKQKADAKPEVVVEASEEPAPAPRRRRRRAKTESEPEPASAASVEESPPPRRRRRGSSEAKQEGAASPGTESGADEPAEPKPRRRRRTAKTADPPTPTDSGEASKPPAPRRRRRKSATAEQQAAPEPSAESPPRRRRRKAAASDDQTAETAKAEGAPKRRRRRSSE